MQWQATIMLATKEMWWDEMSWNEMRCSTSSLAKSLLVANQIHNDYDDDDDNNNNDRLWKRISWQRQATNG